MIRTIVTIALGAIALSAFATETNAKTKKESYIGGSYLVYRFEGLPSRDGAPAIPAARWTAAEYQDLLDLDLSCRQQMEAQLPSAAGEIARQGIKNLIGLGIGSALGTGLGAIAAFSGVTFKDYAVYGGLAGAGSGLGAGMVSGSTSAKIARNYAQFACMQWTTQYVAQQSGRLSGIGVLPYAGTGKTRMLRVPPAAPEGSRTYIPPADARTNGIIATPLP